MRTRRILAALGAALVYGCGGTVSTGGPASSTPTPTATPSGTPTATPTTSPSATPTPTAPPDSGSLSFSGAQYVRVSSPAVLSNLEYNGAANLMVEAWIRPASLAGTQTILAKSYDASRQGYSLALSSNGALSFEVMSNDPTFGHGLQYFTGASSPGVVSAGSWTHVAVVYDWLSAVYFYVNGNEISDAYCHSNIIGPNQNDLFIGAALVNAAPKRFFHGEIDEIRMWYIGRTPSQFQTQFIQPTMYTTLLGNEDGLLAYWPFDEGAGDIAADRGNGSLDGTLGIPGADAADPTWSTLHPFGN